MSNKLGAFDSSFRNSWSEKNDLAMPGLEDSVGFTAPIQMHADRIGQIFENSQIYNHQSELFSPPIFNEENIEKIIGCGSSSEPNSLLPESPTNIELEFPKELRSENFRLPLALLAMSSTEARATTLEEDQFLIESKRQESHLENSPKVRKRGIPQDDQALSERDVMSKKRCWVIKQPKWNKEDENQLIQLVAEGRDWLEIGNLLKRSSEAAKLRYEALTRNSHQKKRAKWTGEEITKLFQYRDQGIQWDDIGNELGRTPNSIMRFYKKRVETARKNPNSYLYNKISLESMTFPGQPGSYSLDFSDEKWSKEIEQMLDYSSTEDEARNKDNLQEGMPLKVSEALQDKSWTKEETNALMQHKNIRNNWAKVAKSLGKNITDVKTHYWSMTHNKRVISLGRLSTGIWTKEDEQKLIEYRIQGKTWREIGGLLGKTEIAASSRYKAICKRKEGSDWTKEDEKKLIEYRSEGKEWWEIGARLERLVQEVSEHYEVIYKGSAVSEWTEKEDALLNKPSNEISELPKVSFSQYLATAAEFLEGNGRWF